MNLTLQDLTELLGWVSIVNISLLVLAAISLMTIKQKIVPIHAKMFGLSEDDLLRAYFQYLAQFKIVVLVFNVAPYLALKLMGQ